MRELVHQRQGGGQKGERLKRCCSASTSTTMRLPRQLITRTPVSHPISSFETDMTCSRRPVAGFTFSLSLVWLDLWKSWPAGPCVWCAVFMPSSLFFLPIGVFTNAYEEFAKARKE